MFRRIMVLRMEQGADEAKVQALKDCLAATAEHIPTVLASWAGDAKATPGGRAIVWDTFFADERGMGEYRDHPYHVDTIIKQIGLGKGGPAEKMHSVLVEPYAGEVPEPGIKSFLKRTLLLQTMPGATPEQVAEFEHKLTQMPRYVKGIRNWSMSRNPKCNESPKTDAGVLEWTHVWEQEFQDEEGFRDYMENPFHWAWVDLMFDPDGPSNVCSAHMQLVYPMETTILGWKP